MQSDNTRLPLILLDLDGTLVDSRGMIVRIAQVAAREIGLPVPEEDAVASIIGLSLEPAMARLYPNHGPEDFNRLAAAYRKEALRIRDTDEDAETLFDGAREMVAELRAAGFLLGIATGKARRGALHFCARYGMEGWFDTIQTPDTNPGKPYPGMIESAMAETGTERNRTVMVGDTVFDLEMARNADVFGVGVTWGNHPTGDLEAAAPHHIVQRMDDLPQVIGELLAQGTHP